MIINFKDWREKHILPPKTPLFTHQDGNTLTLLTYILLLVVIFLIVPSYTYTLAFWQHVVQDTIFNFSQWVK